STSLRLLTALPPFRTLLTAPAPLPWARVTSVGNRWRPPYGGSHERRIHGTPTCHYSPPLQPLRLVHLPGPGAHRGLVSQVVAPLSRRWRRWPVPPDPVTKPPSPSPAR